MNIKFGITNFSCFLFFLLSACSTNVSTNEASSYDLVNPEVNQNVRNLYFAFEERLPASPPDDVYSMGKAVFDALDPEIKADYESAALHAAKYPKSFVSRMNSYLVENGFNSLFKKTDTRANVVDARYSMIEAIPKLAGIHWKLHTDERCLNYCNYLGSKNVVGVTNQIHAAFYVYLSTEYSKKTTEYDVLSEFELKKQSR